MRSDSHLRQSRCRDRHDPAHSHDQADALSGRGWLGRAHPDASESLSWPDKARPCLPDEINLLRLSRADVEPEPRRLLPARDDALPLYVQTSGTRIGKCDDELVMNSQA